jgi:hypothetical protein
MNRNYKILKEELIRAGFDKIAAARLTRLMRKESTPDEKRRWIESRVMDEDGIILVDPDFDETMMIQLALFNLTFEGKLTKTQRGYIDADQ